MTEIKKKINIEKLAALIILDVIISIGFALVLIYYPVYILSDIPIASALIIDSVFILIIYYSFLEKWLYK